VFLAAFFIALQALPRHWLIQIAVVLLAPLMMVLVYQLFASSIHLTMNEGFTPVAVDGNLTFNGVLSIYRYHLVFEASAFALYLLLKALAARRGADRSSSVGG
jgi:hypothetical protein